MSYTALTLAESFIRAGELDDALDVLTAHLAEQPDDDEARRLRGAIHRYQDRPQAAIADYDALSQPTPEDFIAQADILQKLGDIASAVACLGRGYEDHPEHDRLAESYLHFLSEGGYIEQARIVADEQIMREPRQPGWRVWAGQLAMLDEAFADAVRHYTHIINVFLKEATPNTPTGAMVAEWRCVRGSAYVRLDDPEPALEDYLEANELVTDDPMILFNIAVLMAQLGYVEDAREWTQYALSIASPLFHGAIQREMRSRGLAHLLETE